MRKTALVLMILAVISKFFGFGREIALSYFYGTSMISDAYLISLTIPGTIFAFIGAGIATSYIPMYVEIEKQKGIAVANRFTSNMINLVILICAVIIFLTLTQTVNIVKIFASGFEGETLKLAVKFTRISVLGIFFSGIVFILTRYLQIKGKFNIPALLGIPFNFAIVAFIVISGTLGEQFLPVGIVIAMALELLLLIPFAIKSGYKHKFTTSLKDKYLKKMIILALPVILGTSVNQINTLIDRTIASQLELGGISALNYANRLNFFILGIFVTSITTVMYPMISKMAANKNIKGLKGKLTESLTGVSLLLIPATVGTLIFAEPIVQLLFGRGAFDSKATLMTSNVLFFYSLGMIGVGFREILSNAFYSLQDTKTPMINAVIGVILNIILNIILSKHLGVGGLALATSISAIFTAILLFISLRIKIGPLKLKNVSKSILKITFSSLIMGLTSKLCFDLLIILVSQNISLFISIVVGSISYLVIILLMRIDDVNIIINAIKGKIKKNKKVNRL
ncbi:murein biosynthesis integral membrane protein MurJ [Neobacillus sp. DY30]|uniref:murein biosynthesis integral membrane protein MurJ n=1 Tax=Neobacillus sp. DY30 TaxID=3047871 RepID=UPI0024C029C2|nr:murein biosynthesis integral membrane protein MurJ [Neobacillus sp. DY30]WHY00414.1 murein biosynthesis integral membrane protein MurJ [Neobacillus sp. DY30]